MRAQNKMVFVVTVDQQKTHIFVKTIRVETQQDFFLPINTYVFEVRKSDKN